MKITKKTLKHPILGVEGVQGHWRCHY